MKVAPISPTNNLGSLWTMRCSYHLALGQELVRDIQYRRWYCDAIGRGDFVIVDNGAAEPEAEREPFEKIALVATAVNADEVVMPDVLYNAHETIYQTTRFKSLVPAYKRLVIPQGRTINEWLECLKRLTKALEFRTIGIPKHLEKLPGGRAEALTRCIKRGYHTEWAIHLFGVYADPLGEVERALEVYPGVRGIDSGCMAAYAQHDATIQRRAPRHYSLDWRAPCEGRVFERNIAILREAAKCTSI